jgi:hypothetical protein
MFLASGWKLDVAIISKVTEGIPKRNMLIILGILSSGNVN